MPEKEDYINSKYPSSIMRDTKKKSHRKDMTLEEEYGTDRAKEIRNKISEKNQGKHYSIKTEFKKGIIPWNKNKKGYHVHSETHKKKLSDKMKGETNPAKIPEVREKIRLSKLGPKNWMHGRIGDKNPAWLGGKSFEPYTPDFNNKFKEAIRERDNNCCVVCNKHESELKIGLCVHHADYNKLNTLPQNCLSLCQNCHLKTNLNRQSWKIFFQNLLKERYGYEYTIDQKIILDFNKGDI